MSSFVGLTKIAASSAYMETLMFKLLHHNLLIKPFFVAKCSSALRGSMVMTKSSRESGSPWRSPLP
jgi:hypothetical protein